MRGLFITGTDTGVGKTVVAAAVAATLAARGKCVAAFKPVVTGLDEPGANLPDHELLRAAARSAQAPSEIAPYTFGPPLSPHLAAELAGVTIEPAELVLAAHRAQDRADVVVVEGVGGLMVPLTSGYLVRDLAADLELPVVIAARPGLGTISHTLLTIEGARAAGLRVAGVVMTPWPAVPARIHESNRETVTSLGRVEVTTLGAIDIGGLAQGAADPEAWGLPVDAWIEPLIPPRR